MIPSYFDLVRVKNYLKENSFSFGLLSEYTSNPNISRSRLAFFKGELPLLLVTERFHFFKRYHIRGSFNVCFYDIPDRSDFYSEFVNSLDVEKASGEASVTVLYTKFDALKLERVVGYEKCVKMCQEGNREAFMFS